MTAILISSVIGLGLTLIVAWIWYTIERNYKILDFDSVTRVEVIDAKGRSYVKYGVTSVELSLQDDARTLKVFLTEDTIK